jgi:ABC-2 type transport system permease protein
MFKLGITILKDLRLLGRDKVGIAIMFLMPVLLVLVITSLQVNTFKIVNDNRIHLLLCNRDTGEAGLQLVNAINKAGMFELTAAPVDMDRTDVVELMHAKDAMVAIVIPSNFSEKIEKKSRTISERALKDFGVRDSVHEEVSALDPIILYYHPVLQESYRQSMQGALRSALSIVESRQILQKLYFSLNQKSLPDSLESEIVNNQIGISEIPVSRNGSRNIPNASQHNVPAWTLFAMFFIVTSLGANIVKEKLSGSFARLKTLPTNYLVALLSKQITYLIVCLAQVAVIFSMGVWLFPHIGLPRLNIPDDILGLLLVSVVCGWCAISYAMCIGVLAGTLEQVAGFGAVSVVILAAIGGILVPGFAMPESFQLAMKISPLHWGLESYYGLFLEGGTFRDVVSNLVPLLFIIFALKAVTLVALKNKNLI